MKSFAPRMNWKCNIVHHFEHNIISIIKKKPSKNSSFTPWKYFLSYVVMSIYNPLTGGLRAPQLPELWSEISFKSAPWCCAIVNKHLFSPFYFTEHRKTQNTAEHWTKKLEFFHGTLLSYQTWLNIENLDSVRCWNVPIPYIGRAKKYRCQVGRFGVCIGQQVRCLSSITFWTFPQSLVLLWSQL